MTRVCENCGRRASDFADEARDSAFFACAACAARLARAETTTRAQRDRYARRAWAAGHIGATVVPETAHAPMDAHGPDLYASLFEVAGRSPDSGEGSRGHLRDEYAWTLRADHEHCAGSGDALGAHDCHADALDALARWTDDDRRERQR